MAKSIIYVLFLTMLFVIIQSGLGVTQSSYSHSVQSHKNGFYQDKNSGLMVTDMKNPNNSITKVMSDNKGGFTSAKTYRKCCIIGDCHMLQGGEKCGDLNNLKTGIQKFLQLNPAAGSADTLQTKNTTSPYVKAIGFNEDEVKNIRNQVLKTSNFYRQKYGLITFTIDEQINNYAQNWANYLAVTGKFEHSPSGRRPYGENLYASSELNDLGEKSVKAWYNEITKFRIGDNEQGLNTNRPTFHMTQLLWKSSTKLGVGVSKGTNGMYNIVCNYDPAGNVIGYFTRNLPKIRQQDVDEAKL